MPSGQTLKLSVPMGIKADLKCDGRRISTGTIFQCYAPYQTDAAQLNKKIDEDFRGAYKNWSNMVEWVLVHNDTVEGYRPHPSS